MLLSDREADNLRPNNPGWVLVRTVAGTITGAAAFYAFSVLPLAQVYAFIFAAPLLITVLSIPILGEQVGLHRWAAVVLGLVGVLIVLRPGSEALTLGHIAGLVAAAGSATVSVITRKVGRQERAAVLMLYPMMANVLMMGSILPFVYQPLPIEHLGLLAIVAFWVSRAGCALSQPIVSGMPRSWPRCSIRRSSGVRFLGLCSLPKCRTAPPGIGAGVIIFAGLYVVLRESLGGSSENTPVLRTRTRTRCRVVSQTSEPCYAPATERTLPGHEALAKSRKEQ